METYYAPEHLGKFGTIAQGNPDLAEKFFAWYNAVFAEGALGEREKALIALGVAHAVQCPYCIDAYTKTCLEKGADLEQMTEAVHVAAAIRGGASHGARRPDARARAARGNGVVPARRDRPPSTPSSRARLRGRRGPGVSARAARRSPPPAAQLRLLETLPLPAATSTGPSGRAGGAELRPAPLEILQINVGRLCNMTCRHCHVDAGPDRVAENMDRETMDLCLAALDRTTAHTVDVTGGAPELNPHFRYLVEQAVARGKHVMDRCNLTVLLLPRCADLPEWLAERGVEVVCSLPHYRRLNTDAQRGEGTFERSIEALRRLNAAGYGQGDPRRRLTLVSNPVGRLPPGLAGLARARLEGRARPAPRRHVRPALHARQHADQPVPGLARREREPPGVHGAAGGDVQPGGGPGAHVPQHALGRVGRDAPRLRLQPDARAAGRGPAGPAPPHSRLRPGLARRRGGSAPPGTASGARPAPGAPAAAPRREAGAARSRTTPTTGR